MTSSEAKEQIQRLGEYNKLDNVRNEIQNAITKITEDWNTGPCNQGPFTGNTRESRRVCSLEIQFSATLGGSPAVRMTLLDLNISAPQLGRFLRDELQKRLDAINEQIKEI